MKRVSLTQTTLFISLIILSVNLWSAGYSFRYKDDQGAIHIGYSVPPEYIDNGYDVLSENGRVVDTIPPKEVLDEQAQKMLEEAETRHQYELQRSKDEALLRYYSEPEDIEIVRQRKMQELDNFIAIQRANILSYKSRIANLQSQAADLERSGQQVPQSILATIETLQENVQDAEQDIAERQQEKKEVNQAFNDDIERLKQLLNKTRAPGSGHL